MNDQIRIRPHGPPTITGIDALPSDPNLRRIRVDGRVVARLRQAVVEQLGLKPGQSWTGKRVEAVKRAQERERARKLALNALGRRALTRQQLMERLVGRGIAEDIAADVLCEFESDGWIDDAAYARTLAEELLERKRASAALIIAKLQQRGVADDVAERVVHELLADRDSAAAAADLARQQLARLHGKPRDAKVRRIAGVLARRGYDEETIEAALVHIDLDPNEGT